MHESWLSLLLSVAPKVEPPGGGGKAVRMIVAFIVSAFCVQKETESVIQSDA